MEEGDDGDAREESRTCWIADANSDAEVDGRGASRVGDEAATGDERLRGGGALALALVIVFVAAEELSDEVAWAQTYAGAVDVDGGEPNMPGRILNGPSSVEAEGVDDEAVVDEGPAIGGRGGRTCCVGRCVMLCGGSRDADVGAGAAADEDDRTVTAGFEFSGSSSSDMSISSSSSSSSAALLLSVAIGGSSAFGATGVFSVTW